MFTSCSTSKGGSQFKRLYKKTRLCDENCSHSLNKSNEQNAVQFRQDIGIFQTSAYYEKKMSID